MPGGQRLLAFQQMKGASRPEKLKHRRIVSGGEQINVQIRPTARQIPQRPVAAKREVVRLAISTISVVMA